MADYNSALQAIIDTVAAKANTAAPGDLAYLGKALEAVAPGSAASLIVQLGESQRNNMTTLADQREADINTLADTKLADVESAGQAKVSAVISAGEQQLTQIANEGLSLVETHVDCGSSSAVSLSAGMKKNIRVTGSIAIDFTVVTLTLPDATALMDAARTFYVKNDTFAILAVLNSSGVEIGRVSPYGVGKMATTRKSANDWIIADGVFPSTKKRVFSHYAYQGTPFGRFIIPGYLDTSNNYWYFDSNTPQLSIVLDAKLKPIALAILSTGYNSSSGLYKSYISYSSPDVADLALNSAPTGTDFASGPNSTTNSKVCFPPLKYGQIFAVPHYNGNTLQFAYINVMDGTRGTLGSYINGTNNNQCNAYGLAFGDGSYAVAVIKPYGSGSTTNAIVRFKMNASGSPTAAGSIALSTSDVVCQISDKHIMVFDGTSAKVFDMTQEGSSLVPTFQFVASSVVGGALAGSVGMYFGANVFALSNGLYRYDGSQTFTKVGDNTSGFYLNSSVNNSGAAFSPLLGVSVSGQSSFVLAQSGSRINVVKFDMKKAAGLSASQSGYPFALGAFGDLVLFAQAYPYSTTNQSWFDMAATEIERVSSLLI